MFICCQQTNTKDIAGQSAKWEDEGKVLLLEEKKAFPMEQQEQEQEVLATKDQNRSS